MKKNTLAISLLLLFASFLYLVTLRGIWGNPGPEALRGALALPAKPFELAPERGRYAHVFSLSENRRYLLDTKLAAALNPITREVAGKYYSPYANGLAFFAVPLYLLGKELQVAQAFAFFTASLFALAMGFVLFKIARETLGLSLPIALFTVLAFSFATPIWSYSNTLYPETATLFLLLSAFYAAWRFGHGRSAWLWSGVVLICSTLLVFVDPHRSILLLPLLIYFFSQSVSWRESDTGKTLSFDFSWLPVFLILVPLMVSVAFFYPETAFVVTGASNEMDDYRNPAIEHFSHKPRIEPGAVIATTSHDSPRLVQADNLPNGFSGILFSLSRGLFVYSPLLLLGVIGIGSAFRHSISREHWTLLGFAGVNIFLAMSLSNPVGGWGYGPKLLFPAAVILALFAGVWLASSNQNFWRRLLAWLLFLFSLGVSVLGAITTNAIPPEAETPSLALRYNFLRNVDFLLSGQSSSLFFNTVLAPLSVTLLQFFLALFACLALVSAVILFWLPHTRYGHDT